MAITWRAIGSGLSKIGKHKESSVESEHHLVQQKHLIRWGGADSWLVGCCCLSGSRRGRGRWQGGNCRARAPGESIQCSCQCICRILTSKGASSWGQGTMASPIFFFFGGGSIVRRPHARHQDVASGPVNCLEKATATHLPGKCPTQQATSVTWHLFSTEVY